MNYGHHGPRWEAQQAGICWECGGDCALYKGTAHGWRCSACIDAYLDRGWAAWTGLGDRERGKRTLASSGGAAPRSEGAARAGKAGR